MQPQIHGMGVTDLANVFCSIPTKKGQKQFTFSWDIQEYVFTVLSQDYINCPAICLKGPGPQIVSWIRTIFALSYLIVEREREGNGENTKQSTQGLLVIVRILDCEGQKPSSNGLKQKVPGLNLIGQAWVTCLSLNRWLLLGTWNTLDWLRLVKSSVLQWGVR